MKFLDLLQGLPIPVLLAATLCLAVVISLAILFLVRWSVRLSGVDPAKPLPIDDLVPVTSIFFALMVAFSASGIWNDWLQARSAVQREALALENVLALAAGFPAEQAAKVKAAVMAYAKAAVEHEWPAMAHEPRQQALAMSLYAVATTATFFVILAHDRPFVGVISVSPKPLLQVAAKANAATPRLIGSQSEAR